MTADIKQFQWMAIFSLSVLLGVVIVISMGVGSFGIEPVRVVTVLLEKIGVLSFSVDTIESSVIWNIRLPRIMLGILVGAAHASSGAALQGIFRNPLVDPGLIGVSAGAALAVAVVIVLGDVLLAQISGVMGMSLVSVAAFSGGLVASWVVLRIAQTASKIKITDMLLAGIAINAITFAGIGLMTYLSNDEQLRTLTFWSFGSLGSAMWMPIAVVTPFIIIPVVILQRSARSLNILALGDREALQLGLDVDRLKKQIVICVALAVGAAVSVSGMIGFIGLVVPHLVRLAFGSDHRLVLPLSLIAGPILLIISDMCARMIVAPAELPIGVLTSLIGGPFFLFLILRNRKKLT